MPSDAVVLLQHVASHTFLHSPDTHATPMTHIRVSSKTAPTTASHDSSSSASSGSLFSVLALPGARDEDAFKIVTAPPAEVDDTLLLLAYKRALSEFMALFKHPPLRGGAPPQQQQQQPQHDWPLLDKEETRAALEKVEHAVSDLVAFCQESAARSASRLRFRQDMMRAHGFLPLLIDMMKAPFDRYGGPLPIAVVAGDARNRHASVAGAEPQLVMGPSRRSVGLRHSRSSSSSARNAGNGNGSGRATSQGAEETRASVLASIRRIVRATSSLLVEAFQSNRESELFMVKVAMPVLMELLGHGFQTSKPLSYLLRGDRDLVDSITSYSSIVRNFFTLIQTRGRSIRYMQFLVALCSSRGRGVPKTQEAICELLFNDAHGFRDAVVVPMRASATTAGLDVLVPRETDKPEHDDDGDERREAGDWTPLASFYREFYLHRRHRELAQYCYGLLQLYVALCTDRNYISIEQVHKMFPRERLLACVADDALAFSLRAVLLDLVRVAFLDCEPQKALTCPNLTRIWTSVSDVHTASTPPTASQSQSPGDRQFFASVKAFCAAYLDALHGKIVADDTPENQLTLSVLRVSSQLVRFGMLSSDVELSRLVAAVVDILDERTDVIPERRLGEGVGAGDKTHDVVMPLPLPPPPQRRQQRNASGNNGNSVRFLGTTLLSESSPRRAAGAGDAPENEELEAPPLIFRFRETTHLDGAFSSAAADALDPVTGISRQYAVGSSVWVESSNAHHSSAKESSLPPPSQAPPSSHGSSHPSGVVQRLLPTAHHHGHHATAADDREDAWRQRHVTRKNRVVMQIKDESCGILQLVDGLRLDFQISVFLSAFRAAYGDPEIGAKPRFDDFCRRVFGRFSPPSASSSLSDCSGSGAMDDGTSSDVLDSPLSRFMFDHRSLQCRLSLSTLARRPIVTVLLQLLMYEHPSLVARALELLLHEFNRHDELLKAMQSVQLLVTSETIMLYQRLKDDVDHLRRLAETTEVWMDLTSKSDFEKADSACGLLRAVRQVLDMRSPSTAPRSASQAFLLTLPSSASVEHDDQDHDRDHHHHHPPESPPLHKTLPNRKLLSRRQLAYVLDCSLGLVSRESGSLDPLHMASFFAPATLRNTRSTSGGVSLAAEARRLLRNLRAPQHVTGMMIDGAHFFAAHTHRQMRSDDDDAGKPSHSHDDDDDHDRRRQRRAIRQVFEESLRFLCTFCTGDADNQALLAPHATMLVEYIAELEVAQQVLVAIYAHNATLYKQLPSELVAAVVTRLLQDPMNPRLLYLLETFLLCDERPVVENQLLVLFQIARSLENGDVLQLFDRPDAAAPQFAVLFERYERLLRGDDASDSVTTLSSSPDALARDSRALEYHVRLLHVLAACATGRSTRCQEICQQLVPLSVACDVLALPYCPDGMQLALLRFLRHAFLLAEDTDAPNSAGLQQLLSALSDALVSAVIAYVRVHHDDDVNRSTRWRLDKKKKGTSAPLSLSLAQSPSESRSLYVVLFGLVPTLGALLRNFGHVVIDRDDADDADEETHRSHSAVVRLVLACASLLAVTLPSDWALPDVIAEELEELLALLDQVTDRRKTPSLPTASLVSLYEDALDREARVNLECVSVDGDIAELWASLEQARQRARDDASRSPAESSTKQPRALDRRGSTSLKALKAVEQQPTTGKALTAPSDRSPARVRPTQASAASQPRSDRGSSAASGAVALPPLNKPRKSAVSWLKGWRRTRADQAVPSSRNPYSRQSTMYLHLMTTGLSLQSGDFAVVAASSDDDQNKDDDQSDTSSRRPRKRFEAFDAFLLRVITHPQTALAMREELNRMVDGILEVERTLAREFDTSRHARNVSLTFNDVVARLVAHVEAFQDARYSKTNATLLDVFCRMIAADQDDWERRHAMQLQLNRLGVTRLVVQLLATRDDDALVARCIELGVALLDGMNAEVQETFYRCWSTTPSVGDGFCRRLQAQIEAAGSRIRSRQLDALRRDATAEDRAWRRRSLLLQQDSVALDDDTMATTTASTARDMAASSRPTTLLFRFLQLLCEGHYLHAQRFLIRQSLVREPVNLVEATTTFLLETYLALADVDLGLMIQLFETITEFCQGPCTEAQETVTNFKFLSTVNALLMQSFERSTTRSNEAFQRHRLRAAVVITLLSLLEGRSDRTIHLQLVQELNFAALHRNLVDAFRHFRRQYGGAYEGNVRCSDDFLLEMGFNIYILLQQLADCFPASATWIPVAKRVKSAAVTDLHSTTPKTTEHDAELLEAFQFFQSHSARVEIVWDHQRDQSGATNDPHHHHQQQQRETDPGGSNSSSGALIAYYFPLHPICFCLTEQSKKKLVWGVSRGANKLPDFYARSDKLVDEMAHQSRLRRRRWLSALAQRFDLFKRLSFALGVAINVVVLLFYQADGIDAPPYAASTVTIVYPSSGMSRATSRAIDVGLTVAGALQFALCSVVLACYLVNSAPLLIKKGWKRRIQAHRARLSKTMASEHRRGANWDDRESFQDTEQLLRSLREREEEYDYLFLPRRRIKASKRASSNVVHANATAETRRPFSSSNSASTSATATAALSASPSARDASTWERVWRFLFGPASVVIGNHERSAAVGGSSQQHSSLPQHQHQHQQRHDVSTLAYLRTVAISLYFLACSPRVLYCVAQIVVALLGASVNHFFFAFHLLDIVNRYQDLSNVLRSVVRPAKVLGLTILLYLVVVYVFAIVGFFFFREDYTPSADGLTAAQREGRAPYQCQRLFQCFLVSLDQGFKSNGGLGGYLRQRQLGESSDSYLRLAFDQLYNFILIIMLLNIVFGVIIDTFASLRTADHDKLLDMQSRCFICSIDAYTFDRKTKRGFHDHIYMEHNMWHYLYLFVHIRKKPITEYNGLELYLAKLMAKKDMTFFPTHRALCLEAPVDSSSDVAVVNHVVDGHRTTLLDAHPATERAVSSSSSSMALGEMDTHPTPAAAAVASAWSPRHSKTDTQIASALERMHGTIDAILAAQTEIKQEQRRLAERQALLIESLAGSGHGVPDLGQSSVETRAPSTSAPLSSLAPPRIGRGIAMTPSSSRQRSPPMNAPDLISPRVVTSAVAQLPLPSSAPSTPPVLSLPPRSSSASRTRRSQPQVFNFDAVVGDDP
ncbi:hypothetical protein PINS_up010472 [Pythium insidiosum]|nr:hypothetical protein PINS_up010472 [Pythium insidiosum]